MIYWHDPDEWKSVSETRRCAYHETHPNDLGYPGCTCATTFGSVRRSDEEIAEIKDRNRREREDRILSEAEAIKWRRGLGK